MPRKRHDQMTADEWKDYLEAFEALHSLETPFPRHVDFLDVHVRMFEDGSGRRRRHPHFLAWHRHLLHRFERALQEVRRSVCVPYWEFYADPAIPAALDDARSLERWRVARHFRFHDMPAREEIDIVRSQKRFHTFERLVEVMIHEPVLAAVGGIDAHGCAGTVATAAATLDPLYWCHLANLDRLRGRPGSLPSRGSHRSGRAPFAHPAPRSMGSLRAEAMHDARCRKREALQDRGHALPGEAAVARSRGKPLAPRPLYLVEQALDRSEIRCDPEVRIMSAQLPRQPLLLHPKGIVPMLPAPILHAA